MKHLITVLERYSRSDGHVAGRPGMIGGSMPSGAVNPRDFAPRPGDIYIGGKLHHQPLPKEIRLYTSTKVKQSDWAGRGGRMDEEPQLVEVMDDNGKRPPKKAISVADAVKALEKMGYKPETTSSRETMWQSMGIYPDGSKKKFIRMFKVTP